ncbi:hypothetical protein JX266_001365 [Neoarthrinium moseri]|nr:hypothetical protein JX266_001365 [Neoarthrinium moseri]
MKFSFVVFAVLPFVAVGNGTPIGGNVDDVSVANNSSAVENSNHIQCHEAGQKRTLLDYVNDNIASLKGYNDADNKCLAPKHTECWRVACQWCSAIFVCNHNDYDINPSCGRVADLAQDIVNQCHTHPKHNAFHYAEGRQDVDGENWSVRVADSDCC